MHPHRRFTLRLLNELDYRLTLSARAANVYDQIALIPMTLGDMGVRQSG
eukprot:SAG31_NODE_24687_length_476_cov_1.055703_1_plen_48_part_10